MSFLFMSSARLPRTAASGDRPPRVNRRPQGHSLKVGAVVSGRVTRIMSFGAFVEAGGAQGLVHISEISEGFVDNIEKFVSLGQTVQVRVLNIDDRAGRISFSMKQCEESLATGYERVIQLGGDWGHPWGDDPSTKWANFGPRPAPKPHYWEPDLSNFKPFEENEQDLKEDKSDTVEKGDIEWVSETAKVSDSLQEPKQDENIDKT